MTISRSEAEFIRQGCRSDCRVDGRRCNEPRWKTIVVDPLVLASGSARLGSRLVVTVKAELVQPSLAEPDQGVVEWHVDVLHRSSGSSTIDTWESRLTSLLTLDRHALCLIPHQLVWRLHVDVLVLDAVAATLDEVAQVAKAAWQRTLLPLVDCGHDQQNSWNVDRDVAHATAAPGTVPQIVTIAVLPDGGLVVDATWEEAACATAHVSVAVGEDGGVCGVYGSGSGLPWTMLPHITAMALEVAEEVPKYYSIREQQGSMFQSEIVLK